MSSMLNHFSSKLIEAPRLLKRLTEVFQRVPQGWALGHHILEGLVEKDMLKKAISVKAIKEQLDLLQFYDIQRVLDIVRPNIQPKKASAVDFEDKIRHIVIQCPSYTVRSEDFAKLLKEEEKNSKDPTFVPIKSTGEGVLTLLSHPLFSSKVRQAGQLLGPQMTQQHLMNKEERNSVSRNEETCIKGDDDESSFHTTDHSSLVIEEGDTEEQDEISSANVDTTADAQVETVEAEEQEKKEEKTLYSTEQTPSLLSPKLEWLPAVRERRLEEMVLPDTIRLCQLKALVKDFVSLQLKVKKLWSCCKDNKLVDTNTNLIPVNELYHFCQKTRTFQFSTKRKEDCSRMVLTHFMYDWKCEFERFNFQMKQYKQLHDKWKSNKKKLVCPTRPEQPLAKSWEDIVQDMYQEMMPVIQPLQLLDVDDNQVDEDVQATLDQWIKKAKEWEDQEEAEKAKVASEAKEETANAQRLSTTEESSTVLQGYVAVSVDKLCEILQRNVVLCQLYQALKETKSSNILSGKSLRIFEELEQAKFSSNPVSLRISDRLMENLQLKNQGKDISKHLCMEGQDVEAIYMASIQHIRTANRVVPVQDLARNDEGTVSSRVSLPINCVSSKK